MMTQETLEKMVRLHELFCDLYLNHKSTLVGVSSDSVHVSCEFLLAIPGDITCTVRHTHDYAYTYRKHYKGVSFIAISKGLLKEVDEEVVTDERAG